VSQSGRFSVVPPAPFRYSSQEILLKGEWVDVHYHEATGDDRYCWIAYFDAPPMVGLAAPPSGILREVLGLLEAVYGWRVVKEADVERSGHPGHLLRVWEKGVREMTIFAFTAGRRVYLVAARQGDQLVAPPLRDRCVDSFEILEDTATRGGSADTGATQ
jgi:hypothetical protein